MTTLERINDSRPVAAPQNATSGPKAALRGTQEGKVVSRGRQIKTGRKGARNEHRSIALFEAAGYTCIRSAASLGPWDFVAFSSSDVALVQVKTRDWPGTVEMEELEMFPAPPNVRKLIHRWRDRERQPDVREVLR